MGLEYWVKQMNLKLKSIVGRENIIKQTIGKMPVFKIKPMEGDDKWKWCIGIYCYHYSHDPSDHTSELDTKSMVDQFVSTHEVIAVGAVTSHVQNMCAYSRAWVTNGFP